MNIMFLRFFKLSPTVYIESDNHFLEKSEINDNDASIGIAIRQALALTAKISREEVVSFMHPNSFARKMRTWIDVWDPLCFACHLEKELCISFVGNEHVKPFPVFLTSWFFGYTGAPTIGVWTHRMVYDWYPTMISLCNCPISIPSLQNESSNIQADDN